MKDAVAAQEAIVCAHCNQPVIPGQGWHTVARMHWDCYRESPVSAEGFAKFENNMRARQRENEARMDAALGTVMTTLKARKRPCRPGEGPTANRLAKRLCEVIERELGYAFKPEELWFWGQPPEYRGPRWDLAVWGCQIKRDDIPGKILMLNSWGTMTHLCKAPYLGLTHEGGMEYGVGEARAPQQEPVSGVRPRGYKCG